MVAVEHNIIIRAGATFTLPVVCFEEDPEAEGDQLILRDLTGWTGAMQIRLTADSDTVLAEADVTIDVDTGTVTATFDDDVTAGYTWRAGVYDLIITDGVDTDWLAEGTARCKRGVTR
jgi:hypothetical protein